MLRVINKLTLDILKDIQKEKYVILQDEQGFGYNIPTKLLYDVVMNALIEANEESIEIKKIQLKAERFIQEQIKCIKEYDIDRPIYSGEAIIDSLEQLSKVLEGEVE